MKSFSGTVTKTSCFLDQRYGKMHVCARVWYLEERSQRERDSLAELGTFWLNLAMTSMVFFIVPYYNIDFELLQTTCWHSVSIGHLEI